MTYTPLIEILKNALERDGIKDLPNLLPLKYVVNNIAKEAQRRGKETIPAEVEKALREQAKEGDIYENWYGMGAMVNQELADRFTTDYEKALKTESLGDMLLGLDDEFPKDTPPREDEFEDYPANTHFRLGELCFNQGKYEEAILHYGIAHIMETDEYEAIASPICTAALSKLKTIFDEHEKGKIALDIDKITAIGAEDIYYYEMGHHHFFETKDYSKAVSSLEKAIEAEHKHIALYQCFVLLGWCYEHLNDLEKAKAAYQKAKEHGSYMAKRRLKELKR